MYIKAKLRVGSLIRHKTIVYQKSERISTPLFGPNTVKIVYVPVMGTDSVGYKTGSKCPFDLSGKKYA